jgi:hypothetical protein
MTTEQQQYYNILGRIVHTTIYVILFFFVQDTYYNILGRNFVDAQDTR